MTLQNQNEQTEEYGIGELRRAVEILRQACDRAESEINRGNQSLLWKASAVLHSFSWGHANATNYIESVMRLSEETSRDCDKTSELTK